MSPEPLPSDEAKGICAAGSCEFCGCQFRKPSDIMGHRCAVIQEAEVGPLLATRLRAEAENPRPESIVRAERGVVRGLLAEGFTEQHQVTHHDRFEIAVDDLVVRVEVAHPGDAAADLKVENKRLRELYENAVGNRERFGWTINHLLECEEALRVAQTDVDVAVAEGDARYNAFIEGLTAKLNAAGVPAVPSWPDAIDWLIERTGAARAEVRAATLREVESFLINQAMSEEHGGGVRWLDIAAKRVKRHFNQEAE